MLKRFNDHIIAQGLFGKEHKLLLAISGGVDSTVLAYLLKQNGYSFSLAHCNFQLRGKDSAADEKFCMTLAKKLNVKIYSKRFDVAAYCLETGTNTQLAARQLRYAWFKDLMEANNWDFVLTAHHANDMVETTLINLLRGTGVNGLKGIPEKNGKIVRPLLCFKRSEIEDFSKAHKIKYRVDQSNNENKYERNFLRNKIVPLLRQLNPQLEETFIRNAFHFQQEAGIVKEFLSNKAVEYTTQTHDALFINKNRLKHEKYIESILNYVLAGYGFSGTQHRNICDAIKSNASVGKIFFSATHQVAVDRSDLIVKKLKEPEQELLVNNLAELKKLAFIKVLRVGTYKAPNTKELIVSAAKLQFPLTFRSRKTGDKFKPFGMKGSKLLSDYMKEQKMNSFEKENCSLLVNGNGEIIWIMGYRSDERYRVTGNEKDLLKLKIVD